MSQRMTIHPASRVALCGAVLLMTALVSGGDANAIPHCKPGWEKGGALCYPKCHPGYKGIGPVCWYQGQKSYGRGAGYVIWSKKKCIRKHGACERNGALWYPKCKPGFKGKGPVCWSRQKLSYGRGAGKPLETVKKAFKDAGQKIKKGFQWLGKKIKEGFKKVGSWMKRKIFDKIKQAFMKFGQKVLDWIMGKGLIGGLINKAIVSLTKKVGFNTADVKLIVGKTGRVTRAAIRKVVLNKLLRQYLQPLIVAKAAKLIEKGLKYVQKPIDIAVGAIIAGVGSIPFAGGVLAAGLSTAYSFGMDKLRSFLAKTISKLLVDKFITPMLHKGLEWIRSKWRTAALALDQLFKDSYYFFDTYIRVSGSGAAAAAASRPAASGPPATAAPPAASGWRQVPGGLKHVDSGADGAVWGVGTDGAVFRRDGGKWVRVPGRLAQISVGSAQHVWGVTAEGNIFRWSGARWVAVPGGLKHVEVGADGEVWGTNRANLIYRWTGRAWKNVGGNLRQVAVGSRDHVWGVNDQGLVFRRTAKGWQQVGGTLEYVSASAQGEVWGVRGGTIFRYTGKGWVEVPGSLRQISAGRGLWGVDAKNTIWTRK